MIGRTMFSFPLVLRLDCLVLLVVYDFWPLDLALVLLERLQLGRVDHCLLLRGHWLLLQRHGRSHDVARRHMKT